MLRNVNDYLISAHLVALTADPQVIPRLGLWDTGVPINLVDVIRSIIFQPNYLKAIYPSLKIVMGNSLSNFNWASTVVISMAFFDAIKVLPQAIHLYVVQQKSVKSVKSVKEEAKKGEV